jgi:hypothetical protein
VLLIRSSLSIFPEIGRRDLAQITSLAMRAHAEPRRARPHASQARSLLSMADDPRNHKLLHHRHDGHAAPMRPAEKSGYTAAHAGGGGGVASRDAATSQRRRLLLEGVAGSATRQRLWLLQEQHGGGDVLHAVAAIATDGTTAVVAANSGSHCYKPGAAVLHGGHQRRWVL